MTSIDPRQQLAAAIRTEVAALRERGQVHGAPAPQLAGAGGQPPPGRAGPARLAGLLAPRIAAIAADDPQRKHKAVRVFLETTLLQELGAGLVNDPAFPDMVEAVQGRMNDDALLAGAADALASQLLAAHPPRPGAA